MRRFLVSLGIVGSLVLVGTAIAADPPTNKPAIEVLAPGDHVGRLVKVNADGNSLVLQITKQRLVLKNPDGPTRTADEIATDIEKGETKVGKFYTDTVTARSLADSQRQQKERDKAVSDFQRNLPKGLNQLQQQQQDPKPVEYITLTEHKDVPLTSAKEVKVRLRELPAIDEDGYVRKYTAEELRAAKGKQPYEPGFEGKLANLKAGDYVRVTIVPVAGGKAKPGDPTTEVTALIVITKEQAEKGKGDRP